MTIIKLYISLFLAVSLILSCSPDCTNGEMDGNETAIDCGGDCPPCPTCFDNQKNGDEDGVDCGGTCTSCFPVVIEKELMITNPLIVDHEEAKTGDLSFKGLIERFAGSSTTPKDLALSFLTTWDSAKPVNGINIESRSNNRTQIINPWKITDAGSVVDDSNWNMNLENAPFRLLSINSRFDLANFNENKVGEGRLTFGLNNGDSRFTMIFECNLQGSSRDDQIDWMQRWHQLSMMGQGSQPYIDTLVSIVKTFTTSSNDLSQLRTNEFLSGSQWEFRELVINSSGLFEETTRKDSHTTDLQGSTLLLDIIDAHGTEVPATFGSTNVLAGNALYDIDFKWSVPNPSIEQQEVLDTLTFKSCVGCHGGLASGTFFTHIDPRQEGEESGLSPFLLSDLASRDTLVSDSLRLPITPSALRTINEKAIATVSTSEVNDIRTMLNKFKNVKRVH